MNEGEWAGASRGERFFDKGTGAPSEDFGEFWLYSDQTHIYFAGKFKVDPRLIVADEFRKGVSLENNEHCSLRIDPYGAANSINQFGVSPTGATSIFLAGGRAAKTEWIGEFEGQGRIVADGWVCEAKVPWNLMTLPPFGKRDVLINFDWFKSNKSNTYEWTPSRSSLQNYCRWTAVDVPDAKRPQTLNLLPYGYVGFDEDGGLVANSGMDMKTELPGGIQAVATMNPDFQNIENGILSLDFSYFERLASDGRPFFQEGANYYQTGFDQRLFVSQRIDEFDLGVNLYGNLQNGKTRFGLMSISDFGRSQSTVFSTSHKFNRSLDIGMAYVGNLRDDQDNDAFQLTSSYRTGDGLVFLNGQYTDDEQKRSGSRLNAGYFVEANGVEAGFEYLAITPDFFPRIGFSPEQDLKGGTVWYGKESVNGKGAIEIAGWNTFGVYYDRFDGGFYRSSFGAGGFVGFRNKLAVEIELEHSNFLGSSDHLYSISTAYPFNDPYRNFGIGLSSGSFQGEEFRSIALEYNVKPAKRVQLSLSGQFVDFNGFDRQLIASGRWDIDAKQSVGGRAVNNGDAFNWYAFYRNSGQKGNEYFLIIGDPNSRTFTRQILLKVVVPLQIKF